MEWDVREHKDWKIVEYTRWLNIENYQKLENRAGVYIFANANHQVKYVGKAGAGRIVKEIYNAMYRGKNRGASLVKVLYTNSTVNAQSLETDLKNRYKPPNNYN